MINLKTYCLKFLLLAGLLCSHPTLADINSVTIGTMSGDNLATEFSTVISFTPPQNFASWQFGFYMVRPFISQQTFNPKLQLQICNAQNTCTKLSYQKNASIFLADKSAGYTTILMPTTAFPLSKGQPYTIKLLHNNQGAPGNYSGLPQNFFIAANNTIYTLASNKNTYQLLNYNQSNIDNDVYNHLSTNWYNSNAGSSVSNIIVPSPVKYVSGKGAYQMANGITIHNVLSTDNTVATMLQQDLAHDTGMQATIDNNTATQGIIITKINPALISNNPEGYIIQIQPNYILLGAMNDTGIFYALQTLRQLWNANNTQLASATIIDYPRFKYRGILLDTARHFFTLKEIKNLIDVMAAHKLNTLHIHFADDEGFRLALTDYPSLITIGATRAYGQTIGPMMFLQSNLDITNSDNKPYPNASQIYQGYYSTQDIQTLISYANARKITIIPEIDIPGHARALIKSLPASFVDNNDASSFVSVQGYTDNVIPVCTYNTNISVGTQFTQTINNIINRIATMFNGQTTLYAQNNEINVGADEVSTDAWSNDKSCQGDWANLSALEKSHKFLQDLAMNNQSLSLSGWQQLVQNNDQSLDNNRVPAQQTAHIYVWNTSTASSGFKAHLYTWDTASNGIEQAINLAENGYPTVLAFADQTYFDLAYTPDIKESGFAWATSFSDTHAALSAALSATNTINGISNPTQKTNILGIEGALWSENLASYQHLIYMAAPKMAGLAEASWSPAANTINNNQLDWQNLATRLGCGHTGFLAYLQQVYGVQYRGFPNGIKQEIPAGTLCS
jgi:hexosaminidase